jgi:hypothetical protein
MEKQYKVVNGTYYGADVNDKVVSVLETARARQTRIRLDFGDTTTGASWQEDYDILGRVGRSMGPYKVPILLYNTRSIGGGHILDGCIVKISTAKGSQVLYQHPAYHIPARG